MDQKSAPALLLKATVNTNIMVPRYGVVTLTTITIVAASVVSVRSMDAQTNTLFLKKTRIK